MLVTCLRTEVRGLGEVARIHAPIAQTLARPPKSRIIHVPGRNHCSSPTSAQMHDRDRSRLSRSSSEFVA